MYLYRCIILRSIVFILKTLFFVFLFVCVFCIDEEACPTAVRSHSSSTAVALEYSNAVSFVKPPPPPPKGSILYFEARYLRRSNKSAKYVPRLHKVL